MKCTNCGFQHKLVSEPKRVNKLKYREFVYLTIDELSKLQDRFGVEGASERIDNLNDYLGSKGKKYKSHYHTILVWDRKREGEKPKPALSYNQPPQAPYVSNVSPEEAKENRAKVMAMKGKLGDRMRKFISK